MVETERGTKKKGKVRFGETNGKAADRVRNRESLSLCRRIENSGIDVRCQNYSC